MNNLTLVLVASDRPLLYVDATLFINIGLWLVLFVLLRGLLWGPMIRLITARESGMEGARGDAKTLESDGKKKRTEYEEAQKRARETASAERNKILADAKKKETEILADARTRSLATLETQRAEIKKQREALQLEIRGSVPGLATDIATKVLGREVRVS